MEKCPDVRAGYLLPVAGLELEGVLIVAIGIIVFVCALVAMIFLCFTINDNDDMKGGM